MKLRDLIKRGQDTLKASGIDTYENDVRILAMHTFNLNYTGIIMKMNEDMDEELSKQFMDFVELRSTHFPCQYITGSQEFMGYEFKVAREVLIPRPETELLVEEALKCAGNFQKCNAIDVCTGSRCIGISFALKRKEAGFTEDNVTLLDISDNAINLSTENNNALNAHCNIVKSDLFENICGKYDIIISNPPYIKSSDIEELMEEVRLFEPRLALDGLEDGLYFYDKIIKEAREYLNDKGKLLFEIGYDQFEDVRRLLIDAGYSDVYLKKDYAGLDRVVVAALDSSF